MNNVGCAPSPYFDPTFGGFAAPAAYGGYGAMPYGAAPLTLATPGGWGIVGADAPAAPGVLDKVKTFLGEESLGIKNGYWLGAGVAVAGIWIAYGEGWLGRR